MTVREPKIVDLKIAKIQKGETIKNIKAPVYRVSLLYSEKANAKELRGFSLQEVADEIDEELKSRAEQLKKERDASLLKIKELVNENEKLRAENDSLAGKLSLLYSMGVADGSIRVSSVERKEVNIEFWQNIMKWIIIGITILGIFCLLTNANIVIGWTGVLVGGGIIIVLILMLLIIVINAARRF